MGLPANKVKLLFNRSADDMKPLISFLHESCQCRKEQRRPVTLPWLCRITKDKIKMLEECGHTIKGCSNFTTFTGSRTWCWRWLCSNGYLSRLSGNKRPNSPEKIRKNMKKWLHFLRAIVFYAEDVAAVSEMLCRYVFVCFLSSRDFCFFEFQGVF